MKVFTLSLVLLCLLLAHRVDGQSISLDRAQRTPAAQEQPVPDPLGRSTPHGTVSGLVAAAGQGNFDRAGEYLESTLRPPARRDLARQLWLVIDRRLVASLDRLSRQPEGDGADGLLDGDRVGVVEGPSGNVEILLHRVQRQGSAVWLFSASTLAEIPRLAEEIQPPWIEQYLPEWLRTTRWLSLPLYRWLGILIFLPLTFAFVGLFTRVLISSVNPLFRRLPPARQQHMRAGVPPLRLLILAAPFYAASFFGGDLAARHFWHRVADTLAVVALCWLALRLIDVAADLSLMRLQRAQRSADTALVRLINRLLKAATVILAGLVLLFLADVDLTAALTGLGVGGLAIGFGAQKTIENLFGGIMVISDKPVNVGDVCRAGEFFGTVEDIGIRSTRIRTLDRTVVSVPNGQLAMMSLENFAMRDQIRFHHTIGLSPQTTATQVRSVLLKIRQLLEAHPTIERTSSRTRFIRVSGTSLDIEILAYVLERDPAAFLAIQEELLLGIMDIIDACGVALAAPVTWTPPAPGALRT